LNSSRFRGIPGYITQVLTRRGSVLGDRRQNEDLFLENAHCQKNPEVSLAKYFKPSALLGLNLPLDAEFETHQLQYSHPSNPSYCLIPAINKKPKQKVFLTNPDEKQG